MADHRENHADRHQEGGPDDLTPYLDARYPHVDTTGLNDGDGLVFDSGSGLWVPADLALSSEVVTDHGALTGLGDDDHTQYTRKDTLTTQGDLYYRDGSGIARLARGSDGQVLKSTASTVAWGAPAMALIAEQTLGSAASSVTFSSIPGTYKHLRLVGVCRCNDAVTQSLRLRFNNVSTANYDSEEDGGWYGASNGGASGETSMFLTFIPGNDYGSPYAAYIDFILPFYSGSTFMKTAMGHGVLTDRSVYSVMGALTTLSAAITQLGIFASAGNLVTGSSFSLYGLA